ncbi:MAG: PAS domain S-box protein, partial [Gemmatimonadaceae bacterium]|nr:PAS domain S-box protein [Gemmatimonadaceae bacterium]
MTHPLLLALIQNAALLLALVAVVDLFAGRRQWHSERTTQVMEGVGVGVLGIGLMVWSYRLEAGIIFDTRSVLLSVSGLFLGAIPTVVAMLMTATFRFLQGGAAAWPGIAVIVVTGTLGILWRRRRRGALTPITTRELYLFGIVAHVLMLACMLLIPGDAAWRVLRAITWPVLLVYPAATTALGLVLTNRLRRFREADALAESEERLRLALKAARMGTFDWRLTTDEITWSPQHAELWGYRPGEFAGNYASFAARLHPDDVAGVNTAVAGCIASREPFDREFRVVWPDQSVHWISSQGEFTFDELGAPTRMRGVVYDITASKMAEAALRESEARYRQLLDIAPVGVAVHAEGKMVFINPAGVRLLGASSADEIVGLSVAEIVAPERREAAFDRIQRLMQGETGLYPVQDVYLRRDGTRIEVEVLAARLTFNGKPAVQVIATDITERRIADAEREQLRAQLLQAQKMESIGRLAGGVAHDFNNMLVVILGETEMALEQLSPDDPMYADLSEVRRAALHSAEIVAQLLAFARKQPAAPRQINLNETVEQMLQVLRRLIGEDISLEWRPGDGLPPLTLDPTQVDQVLTNLCVNARDAIDDVGRVVIETGSATLDEAFCATRVGSVPGTYVLLSVRDSGVGMSADVKARMFEPYFTTKPAGKGSGLGLATVFGIVEQNHGFIDVESAPGRGTTVRIYLPWPAAATTGHPEPGRPATGAASSGATILLVEDEPAILRVATRMLEQQGYRVLAAPSPSEGLRLAASHDGTVDLVITDVVMPGMNGRELTEQLVGYHPHLRCLYMSGYTADVISHHGVLDTGVHFLQKP